jgi:uroporphyrinogen III methyltransferase/synthase
MQHRQAILGRVYLVGAGPGDPKLITLRGAECLRRADLVLYDCLVNPAILDHVPPSVELVRLGRRPGERIVAQQEAATRMVDAAREGKTVVQLKGGDPDVFGRTAPEVEALRAAGVPFEVVPGITAAMATAGYAEIPVTHPGRSSAVALITAHQKEGAGGPPVDYARLAHFPGTLVFYMGESSAGQWSGELIRGGKAPDTPVAIVRRVSWSDQQTIRCTLGEVSDVIGEQGLGPPAVVVVGEVVSMAPEVSWFAARPLFGTRVLVTRPRAQAEALCDRLTELGARVDSHPVIEISDPPDWDPVDRALERLNRYDWLVFSSANGVDYLLDRLLVGGGDLRRLGGVRLAAIGPATADELARYRLRADLVPDSYRTEALAAALSGEAAGKAFLLARASRGREVLAEQLEAAGAAIDQIVVYSSTDVGSADPDVAEALSAGRIDWVTVTSSAIARSAVRLFGDALGRARLASISPVTSGVLRQLGYEPAVEAARYTMEGLADAIVGFREDKALEGDNEEAAR